MNGDADRAAQPSGSEVDTLIAGEPRRADVGVGRGTTVGRYVVIAELGAGGMGVVYSAYDPQLDRRIALKLLRPEPGGSMGSKGGHERLLREAQAMAKLHHPNVVAVHDVGTHEGEVFVAMEFIEGLTLRQWLETPREWKVVLDVFRQAGAGLAAAHRAGIVHRDFKPDNMMIDAEGRPRVLDFGLARPTNRPPSTLESVPEGADSPSGPVPADLRLTQTGAIVGTPAYMAPEQHLGKAVSAKSDQFSFCVALFEALYGVRPFRGDSLASLAFNVSEGQIREVEDERGVPKRIRSAIHRGLSTRAADRWPTMDALVSHLSGDSTSPGWLAVGGVAAALAVAGVAYGFGVAREEPPAAICEASETRLEGVWDDATREAAEAGLHAVGRSYSGEVWARVGPELDAYAEQWVAMHTDACEDTHVRAEQSEAMMDLRMGCLDVRRAQLAAVSGLLADADDKVLDRATKIVDGLPSLEDCGNREQLALGPEPPPNQQADAVAEIRASLAEIAAMVDAGRYDSALEQARNAFDRAEETDYDPVIAEAGYWMGYNLEKTGDPDQAEKYLSNASFTAQASGHDFVAAKTMILLVFVVGNRLARLEDSLDWARHARALVKRLGDEILEAELANNQGSALETGGRAVEAKASYHRALELRIEAFGPEHVQVGKVHNNLAIALDGLGETDKAIEHYEKAVSIARTSQGDNHPSTGIALTNFGELLGRSEEPERARAMLEEARAIFERTVGTEHAYYASATTNLATLAMSQGDADTALELLEETKEVWVAVLGPDHHDVALAELNLGAVNFAIGRTEKAVEHLTTSLEIYERALGDDHVDVADVLGNLGVAYQALEKFDEALGAHSRALEIYETQLPEGHASIASAQLGVGLAFQGKGEFARAIGPLEAALDSAIKQEDTEDMTEIRFDLAQALYGAGGQRKRAKAMMQQAAEGFDALDRSEDAEDARRFIRDN